MLKDIIMKRILIILVLFFISSNLNAEDKIIECNYIAEVDKKYINNNLSELTEEMLLLIRTILPLNLKVDLKYIDKNNWNVINLETQVDDWFNDFKKIKLPKKINKKEALIIQNVFAFMGVELTINEIMDGTVISLESISNEDLKQLQTVIKTNFEKYRQEIGDFINPKPDRVFSDPEDIDYLTGRKLNNYVILRWTLDSGILIRNKFEYPNIINESTTNATIKMVGTDGGILLDTTGTCYNSNVSKGENKTESNQSDSIESKLKKLKSLFENELITQDEYDAKRKEILDEM